MVTDTLAPDRTRSISRLPTISKTTGLLHGRGRSATVTGPAPTPSPAPTDKTLKRRSAMFPLRDHPQAGSASTSILSIHDRKARRQSLTQPTAASLARRATQIGRPTPQPSDTSRSTSKRHSFTPPSSHSTSRLATCTTKDIPDTKRTRAANRSSWAAAGSVQLDPARQASTPLHAKRASVAAFTTAHLPSLSTSHTPSTRPDTLHSTRDTPSRSTTRTESAASHHQPNRSTGSVESSRGSIPSGTTSTTTEPTQSDPPLSPKSVDSNPQSEELSHTHETQITRSSSSNKTCKARSSQVSPVETLSHRASCEACNRHIRPRSGLYSPRSMSSLEDAHSLTSSRSATPPVTPETIASPSGQRRLKRQSCPSFTHRLSAAAPAIPPIILSPPPAPATAAVTAEKSTVASQVAVAVSALNQSTVSMDDIRLTDMLSRCESQAAQITYLSCELVGSEKRFKVLLDHYRILESQEHQREREYKRQLERYEYLVRSQRDLLERMETLMDHEALSVPCLPRSTTNPPLPSPPTSRIHSMDPSALTMTRVRWHLSRLVGGTVSTGSVVRDTSVILVTGTSMTTERDLVSDHLDVTLSSVYYHQYTYPLTSKDRRTVLVLLSRSKWISDSETNQCQFQHGDRTCSQEFSLFERRHHCRRCGYIFCHQHSANQLPLFASSDSKETWSRVCDVCFFDVVGPHLRLAQDHH